MALGSCVDIEFHGVSPVCRTFEFRHHFFALRNNHTVYVIAHRAYTQYGYLEKTRKSHINGKVCENIRCSIEKQPSVG